MAPKDDETPTESGPSTDVQTEQEFKQGDNEEVVGEDQKAEVNENDSPTLVPPLTREVMFSYEKLSEHYVLHLPVNVEPPDSDTLEEGFNSFNDDEKEEAARASYGYYVQATEGKLSKEVLALWRDLEVVRWFIRYYADYYGKTAKAIKKMRETIEFRIEKRINEARLCFFEPKSDYCVDIEEKIRHWTGPKGRNFNMGYDKDGRAGFQYICRNSPPVKHDGYGAREAMAYCMEKALACTERKTNGKLNSAWAALDFNEFKLWHVAPVGVSIDLLQRLTAHWPQQFHRAYLIDAPSLFRSFWALIKPFISKELKERVVFINGDEEKKKVLGPVIDKSQAMPFQLPDGDLSFQVDIEKQYTLPFDRSYNDVYQS